MVKRVVKNPQKGAKSCQDEEKTYEKGKMGGGKADILHPCTMRKNIILFTDILILR